MSAAWDNSQIEQQSEARAKRALRLWGYLAVAGSFLVYVAMELHLKLF